MENTRSAPILLRQQHEPAVLYLARLQQVWKMACRTSSVVEGSARPVNNFPGFLVDTTSDKVKWFTT